VSKHRGSASINEARYFVLLGQFEQVERPLDVDGHKVVVRQVLDVGLVQTTTVHNATELVG
jgi:hypothetical protein